MPPFLPNLPTSGDLKASAILGLQSIIIRPKRSIGPYSAQVTLEEVHHDELEISDHPVEQGATISDHAWKRPSEIIIRCLWSNSPSVVDSGDGLSGASLSTAIVGGIQSQIQNAVITQVSNNGGNAVLAALGSFGAPLAGAAGALLGGNAPNQIKDVYQKLLKLQSDRVPFDVLTGKRSYTNMLVKSLSVTTDKMNENALSVTAILREVIIVSTKPITVSAPSSAQAEPGVTAPTSSLGTKLLGATVDVQKEAVLQATRIASSSARIFQ